MIPVKTISIYALIFVAIAAALPTPAAADNETASDLVYKARVAAAADNHREAINFYLAAIDKNPAVLADVSIELAHQYTWAEMPDSAIWWYQYTLLDTLIGKPVNLDAELGICRALAWADRLYESDACYEKLLAASGDRRQEVLIGWAKTKSWRQDYGSAEKMYREVLDEDPSRRDAKLGLAEVLLWSGRPRQARDAYKDLLEEDPGDAEAIEGLARAQSAVGRPDVALKTLGAAAAGDLGDSIDKRGSVSNSNTLLYRDNTTDGDYRALVLLVGVDVASLTHVAAEYTKGRMTQEGRPDIDRDQLLVPLTQRFSEALAVTLSPGYQWNRFDPIVVPPRPEAVEDFGLFVWDAYATILPSDWVRLDIANSRQTLTIPQTVFRQIDFTTTSLGLDWQMSSRFVGYLVPSYRTYSDGNARFALGQRLEWTSPLRLPIEDRNFIVLFQSLEYFDFTKTLDNGYFNPSQFGQGMLGARLVWDIRRRLNLNVSLALGTQRESDLDWTSTGAFEAEARLRISANSFLRAGYVHSGSRLRTADGFRAKGFFVTVDIDLPR